jgi:hypothetical protein
VLNPEVVVNLLPELNVGMDLMMWGRWAGERFTCGAGWFAQLALSLSALPSKTNEFHKRLSSGEGCPHCAEALLQYYAQQRRSRCLRGTAAEDRG